MTKKVKEQNSRCLGFFFGFIICFSLFSINTERDISSYLTAFLAVFFLIGSLGWLISDLLYNKTKKNRTSIIKDSIALVFISFYITGFILFFFNRDLSQIISFIGLNGLFFWSGWVFSMFLHKNDIDLILRERKDLTGLSLLVIPFLIGAMNIFLNNIILSTIAMIGQIGLMIWFLWVCYDIWNYRVNLNDLITYEDKFIPINKEFCPVCEHERKSKKIRICEECGLDFSKKNA